MQVIIFESIAAMGPAEQLYMLAELRLEIDKAQKELEARPDYAAHMRACRDDGYESIAAQEARKQVSSQSSRLGSDINSQERDLQDLRYYLYLESFYPQVRAEMGRAVDAEIKKAFGEREIMSCGPERKGQSDCIPEFHNALSLMSFGGQSTENRPDVAPLVFEFNVQAQSGPRPATPWTKMSKLYATGMIVSSTIPTTGRGVVLNGNNLTLKGLAVLARLDEVYGPSNAARVYKQRPSTSAPGF